ncbi:MAG: formylglycine-generating enzyme family protein, partial [Anaerolineales bacterium]
EWCLDGWDEGAYKKHRASEKDPCHLDNESQRVLRGGAFYDGHRYVRGAVRGGLIPDYRDGGGGFRACASPIHHSEL